MTHLSLGRTARSGIAYVVAAAVTAVPVAVVPAAAAATSAVATIAGARIAAVHSVHTVHSAAMHSAGAHATAQSTNWAGYVKPGKGFTSTSATWKIPTVLTTYPGASAQWVGLDGSSKNDQYLIQTGIEADVMNGATSYYAWWEVITPSDQAPEVEFTSLKVKPGDSITASVTKGTGGKWTMTVKDNTTKKSASHVSSYAGPGASAEWIIEDTDVNGTTSTAPDWQSIAFSSILLNKAKPNLTSSEALEISSPPNVVLALLGSRPIRETATGAPNSTKNGFTVKWLATGTSSPGIPGLL